jgi:hypothetical protein
MNIWLYKVTKTGRAPEAKFAAAEQEASYLATNSGCRNDPVTAAPNLCALMEDHALGSNPMPVS